MPNLPLKQHAFYAGIDPGFSGAIAVMNAAGTSCKIWDMPIIEREKDRQREIDLAELHDIFRYLCRLPDCVVGIEWPTTRPGEGSERSERFGRGKGYLEAFAFLHRLSYFKLAPNLWKGRLGLDGKTVAGANERAARLFTMYYPERAGVIRGPRGGVLDGRMDAGLICHFLRTQGAGAKSIVARFGKDSPEVIALIFGGARRKRKFVGPRLDCEV